jgi:hypothetical protein
MKIYNTFPFFNELDLLEIRLNELYDVVDYFVIIEGERTHQNEPKPLYYQENKERYAKFQDKIIHLVLSEENFNNDSYYNEIISFDAFTHALDATDAQDDDIVIIECADEITKAEVVVELAKSYTQPCFIEAHNFCYYLNARFEEGGEYWWTGPIISVGHMKQFELYDNIAEFIETFEEAKEKKKKSKTKGLEKFLDADELDIPKEL